MARISEAPGGELEHLVDDCEILLDNISEPTTGNETQFIKSQNLRAGIKLRDNGWSSVRGVDGVLPTVSYSAAFVMNCNNTSFLTTNMKLMLDNGGSTKYYQVISFVTDTSVTLIGNTALANSAITNVYYSMADMPLGYPYKNTVTAVTGTTHTISMSIKKQLIIATISSNCTMTFPAHFGLAEEVTIKNVSGSTANVIGLPNSEVLYRNMEITFVWTGSAWLKREFTNAILTGTSAPVVTPSFVGQYFIDTTANRFYFAKGVSSSADWILTQSAGIKESLGTIINHAVTPNTTINFGVGLHWDDLYTTLITDTSGMAKTTAAWSAGTGQGGLDTGSVATSTTYHCYRIWNPTTSTVDYLISLSPTAPTMPNGYTKKRFLGSIMTDGSGYIYQGLWYRNSINELDFEFKTQQIPAAISNTAIATSQTNYAVIVPKDYECILKGQLAIGFPANNECLTLDIGHPSKTLAVTAKGTSNDLGAWRGSVAVALYNSATDGRAGSAFPINHRTNNNRQIALLKNDASYYSGNQQTTLIITGYIQYM